MAIGSTIKTVFGFFATLITRYTPIDLSRNSLEGVFNYHRISDSIITSGQPTERQFELVKEAGFRRVINLAPHHAENALPDEAATLASLGMDYTHIPVDFQAPTEANFEENEVPVGDLDGVDTTYTLAQTPSPANSLKLYLNGIRQDEGGSDDFTLTTNVITFAAAPISTDKVLADYRRV